TTAAGNPPAVAAAVHVTVASVRVMSSSGTTMSTGVWPTRTWCTTARCRPSWASARTRAGLIVMSVRKWAAWPGLIGGTLLACSAVAAAAGPPQAMVDAMQSNTTAFKEYMLNCGGCHRMDGRG